VTTGFRVFVRFEWRDLWIGVYVDPEHEVTKLPLPKPPTIVTRRVYVCLVPTLPIIFEWQVVRD